METYAAATQYKQAVIRDTCQGSESISIEGLRQMTPRPSWTVQLVPAMRRVAEDWNILLGQTPVRLSLKLLGIELALVPWNPVVITGFGTSHKDRTPFLSF